MATPESRGDFRPLAKQIEIRRKRNQKRFDRIVLGPPKALRAGEKVRVYFDNFQRLQFDKIFTHLSEETETNDELFYVLNHAEEFMEPLAPKSFDECVSRLTENNYTNADVVSVVAHFIHEGNAQGYGEVRKFLISREA